MNKRIKTYRLKGGKTRDLIIRDGDSIHILRTSNDVSITELPAVINPKLRPTAVADILGLTRETTRHMIRGGRLEQTGETDGRAQTDLSALIDYLSLGDD